MNALDKLNIIFNQAMRENADYVFVGINAHGVREVVAVPSNSFEPKQKFYNDRYNGDGLNKYDNEIYIEFIMCGFAEDLDFSHELWTSLDLATDVEELYE